MKTTSIVVLLVFVVIGVICPIILFWTVDPQVNPQRGQMFLALAAQFAGWITPLAVTALTVNWGEGKKGRALDRRIRATLRIMTTAAFVPLGMLVSLVCLVTLAIDAVMEVPESLMHTAIVVSTILTGVVISLISSVLFQITIMSLES